MFSRVALVLLHFFGSSRREWADVSARFGSEREVIALDLPGFGDQSRMGAASVDEMVEFVDVAIRGLESARVVVVGHSMSGKVATVLASRDPDYLRGLVLVTASPPSPEPMGSEGRRQLLAFDSSREAASRYIDGLTAQRLRDDVRNVAIDDAMRASPVAWKAWVERGSQEDHAKAVGVLDVPTLVIAGSEDPSLGEAVQRERVMPHFARAELVVIAGGHALPFENPAGLHDRIAAFVDVVEAGRHPHTDDDRALHVS